MTGVNVTNIITEFANVNIAGTKMREDGEYGG